MSSYIIHTNGKTTTVKNLGWLLRHWSEVVSLGFNYFPCPKHMVDGELVARMKNGDVYFSDFASISVFWNWVNRPVFRGVRFSLVWGREFNYKKDFVVGDTEWKRLNRLEYKEFFNQVFTAAPQN